MDGDSQGLNRILGALSAHMWPGLILKAEKGLTNNLVLDDDEGVSLCRWLFFGHLINATTFT